MHRMFAGIVSGAALFSAPAAAQSTAGGFAGVWQGTLGAQPVRVCFNQREWGTFGAYYYLEPFDGDPAPAAGRPEADLRRRL